MQTKTINRELTYQVTMIHAKKLLEKHIITQEDYLDFQTLMIEKYHPIISRLSL